MFLRFMAAAAEHLLRAGIRLRRHSMQRRLGSEFPRRLIGQAGCISPRIAMRASTSSDRLQEFKHFWSTSISSVTHGLRRRGRNGTPQSGPLIETLDLM